MAATYDDPLVAYDAATTTYDGGLVPDPVRLVATSIFVRLETQSPFARLETQRHFVRMPAA